MEPFGMGSSSMLAMMNLQRMREEQEEEERRRRRRRFLIPSTYAGEEVPEDTGKLARSRALIAFGAPLLAGAAGGNWGEALAQGATGFSEAMFGTLEERRRIERERRGEEMEREAAERAATESEVRVRGAEQDISAHASTQTREEEERAATASGVREIAQKIGVLLPGSPEAEKAEALAEGPRAYLFKQEVKALYESALARSRRDEDADWKTQQDIEDAQAKVKAGVEEDPLAPGRRAERGLALEAERNEVYRRSVEQQGLYGPGGKPPTQGQFADDVAGEKKKLYDQKLLLLQQQWNDGQPRLDYETKKIVQPRALTQEDLERLDREAEEEARAAVLSRYANRTGEGAGAGDQPTLQLSRDAVVQATRETIAERGEAYARQRLAGRYSQEEIEAIIRDARSARP